MPDLVPPALELTAELQFILDLGVAFAAALLAGGIAARLGQPPIVGYLVAGVIIGPFTPGVETDAGHISDLAELGVVLLLFALGVEFSLRELARVRAVAVPGSIIQIAIIASIGGLVAIPLGIAFPAALVVGGALSISSTLVVLKILMERGQLDSLHGRVAVGWMIMQDLATILMIAMLPPLAGGDAVGPILLALVRTAAFLALAFIVGTRVLPRLFRTVSRLGSPELFLMAVFATALLTAFVSSAVFGLSLALGAFVAGLLVSESELSHQAASEIVPFRDLFAVLFFVSVGMLLDPAALLTDIPTLLVLLVVAVGGKALISMGLGRLLGLPMRSAILLGASIAQVGEFSFLLAAGGLELGILDPRHYNLVLATAVISIILTPFLVQAAERVSERMERRVDQLDEASGVASPGHGVVGPAGAGPDAQDLPPIVVLGAGRVGRVIIRAVRTRGFRCLAVDRDQRRLDEAAAMGASVVFGDGANRSTLLRLGLERARILVIAIGDPIGARLAAERARSINPRLTIVSRARGRSQVDAMLAAGARGVADPEVEAALELARAALQRMGVSSQELAAISVGIRRRSYGTPEGSLADGGARMPAPPGLEPVERRTIP
jgi:monovalent cation:H+ antiporter-2, CPA2 family